MSQTWWSVVHRLSIIYREDFIYFNDDFTLTKKVCYSDFWTPESGYKIHTQGPIGKKEKYNAVCSEDCISVKFSDGQCDEECNTLACLWDGDDCDGVTPKGGEPDHRPGMCSRSNEQTSRNLFETVKL